MAQHERSAERPQTQRELPIQLAVSAMADARFKAACVRAMRFGASASTWLARTQPRVPALPLTPGSSESPKSAKTA